MDQNSFFSDTINREAIKAPTDALFQKSLPGKDITLKTTQTFFKNTSELRLSFWSLFLEVEISVSEIF